MGKKRFKEVKIMVKNLEQWLDEFVDNGADAKDVTNWPENAGGGASKIKTVKAGQKIRIDLSKYTKPIHSYEGKIELFSTLCISKNGFGPIFDNIDSLFTDGDMYYLAIRINQSHTQILCQAGIYSNGSDYDSLMPTTVIYESEKPIILGESDEVPQNIVDLFPTVEIEVTEDIIGTIIYTGQTEYSIPFELVD